MAERPPFVLYGSEFEDAAKAWKERLLSLETTEPITFGRQNFGDYEIPSLRLKEGPGFSLHVGG